MDSAEFRDAAMLLADAGRPLDEVSIERIRVHVELTQSLGKAFGILAANEYEQVVRNHVIDSLSLVPYLTGSERSGVTDLGSGGGFPGLILAAAAAPCAFTLIERSARKCAFLRRASAAIGARNVTIVNGEFPNAMNGRDTALYTVRAIERPNLVASDLAVKLNDGVRVLWLAGKGLEALLSEKFHVEHIVDEWSRRHLRRGDLFRLTQK